MLKDRELKNAFIRIGIPIALQNMLTSLLNMIDTVMIGSLGDKAVASVGLANQWFFIFNLVVFGIVSGSSIFVAQFYGKGDKESLQIPVAYSMALCTAVALIFGLFALLNPRLVMSLFTNNQDTVNSGISYLRIASVSYLMMALSLPVAFAMRTTDSAIVPLAVTGSALIINTALNYILINGHFGAPALGVAGAAIATSTARIIETALIFFFALTKKTKVRLKTKYFKIKRDFIGNYLKTIAPVVGNESMWGLGISMYNVMFGHTEDAIVAANQISKNLEQITTALCIGIGSAGAVVIGRKIGEGNKPSAYKYATKFALISTLMGLALGILMIVFMPAYLNLYSISAEAKGYAQQLMLAIGLFMALKTFNYMCIVGILRSGGDTAFCFWLDAGAVWLVGVVSVYIALFIVKAPFWIVTLCLVSEEFFKAIIGLVRYRSKKWINDLVN